MADPASSSLTSLADAYRGRRVLVTGHTGFKGSWLCLWLERLGAEVHGLALDPPTNPSHFDLCRLEALISHHTGDIRSFEVVCDTFARVQPQVVFHLAAQALVRASYETPKSTFDTNVGGTVNVLEAIRTSHDVRAVVMVTSDKCYENREWVYAYRENDAMGGFDPYSASKGAAELVIAAYRRSFFSEDGAQIASVRAGNVVGGGDWSKDRLIPDCVRALVSGAPIVLRNPGALRPWQHVLEPLYGYLLLGARLLEGRSPTFADAFNFGPAGFGSLTVHEIAELFLQEWQQGRIEIPPSDVAAPHEATVLRLSCEKSVNLLGWRPLLDPVETIRWTVAWYRDWALGDNRPSCMVEVSRRQIDDYETRLAQHMGGSCL